MQFLTIVLIDPKKPHKEPRMVHISRCKPIHRDEQTKKKTKDDKNQPGTSQTIPTNNQKRNDKHVVQTQESTSRYPLRSRGMNVNTLMMLTLICLVNIDDCITSYTTSYTKEYIQKTLGPSVMGEPDVAIIHYIGGKALNQLYTYQIAVLSTMDPVASIKVQILDKAMLKTTFTISSATHTQNILTRITYKEYTIKLLFRYKHLEYEHKFTMSPVGKHLPIHIVNNVITIKNPNKQHHRFVIDYRTYTFYFHRQGKLPMRTWISMGKHRIEFIKKVWFWQTWIQYAQLIQDFEITTHEPRSSFLVE